MQYYETSDSIDETAGLIKLKKYFLPKIIELEEYLNINLTSWK